MSKFSWHLDRRSFLRGTGVTLALPWLEAMSSAQDGSPQPKRFCAFFFGNGVALSNPDYPTADWNWFPRADGADYQFTKSLEPLGPHKQELTIFGQLSHPTSRKLIGHNTGDVWLSGADIRLNLTNSISLDQLIARKFGEETRIPSLVMSSNGGTGMKSRATTTCRRGGERWRQAVGAWIFCWRMPARSAIGWAVPISSGSTGFSTH